ncbi:protein kinase [bacterium]|nr:protein kinase [bacterium]
MSTFVTIKEGERIGPYHILKLEGKGAFRKVFKAHRDGDPQDRFVALSVPFRQDEKDLMEQRREFDVVKGLQHENIVRMRCVEEIGGLFFTVMEFVEGVTLRKILARRGRINPMEAVEYALQVAYALKHAHDRNIGHRDVKPDNIMVEEDGGIKLLDFGLARMMTSDIVSASSQAGTLYYLAPEVFQGITGKKVDIWAMGVMLYEMVMGDFPFVGESLAKLENAVKNGTFELPSDQDVYFPEAYEKIILGCLHRDPARRFNIDELIGQLTAFSKEGVVVTNIEGKINLMLRSGIPYIYLVSYEEDRVCAAIERICQSISRGLNACHLVTWTISEGMRDASGNLIQKQSHDPMQVFSYIEKIQGNTVFLLKDFHPYMQSHLIARQVKDLYRHLKAGKKSVIFLSPVDRLPNELVKQVQLLDFDLPDIYQIERIFLDLVRSNDIELDFPFKGCDQGQLLRATLGLTQNELENSLARAIVQSRGKITPEIIRSVLDEKKQIIRKSQVLEYCDTTESFGNIGGLKSLKSWFRSRAKAYSDKAREFGLPYPRGILLTGAPGCGKSLSAKALAAEWGSPLLKMDIGKLFASIIGSTEKNLRKALAMAETLAPCVLWIDEIDKGFAGAGRADATGVATKALGYFLNWMQDRNAPVFVVATANQVVAKTRDNHLIPLLPPELMRKGRIDEMFFVDLPVEEERGEILKIHLGLVTQTLDEQEVKIIAKRTEGYSGAEIEAMVIASLFSAFADGRGEITINDVMRSIKEIVPLSEQRKEDVAIMREWGKANALPAA